MNNLIAFTGRISSGKSTAANFLVNRHGAVRVSFATPIRKMLEGLGLTPEELQAGKEHPCPLLDGKTPRYALQTLGTEWGREKISPDLWVLATERTISNLLAQGGRVVIDDCRFDNEALMVRRMGGAVIKVERPNPPTNYTLFQRFLRLFRRRHPSERGISPELIDVSILNDGSLQQLLDQVADVAG